MAFFKIWKRKYSFFRMQGNAVSSSSIGRRMSREDGNAFNLQRNACWKVFEEKLESGKRKEKSRNHAIDGRCNIVSI